MSRFRIPLVLLASTLLFGCAHLDAIRVGTLVDRGQPCASFLGELEETISESGVRNASGNVVPGFPYLRANRFYEALGARVRGTEEQEQWIDGMRRLYRESLRTEIRNLRAEVYSIRFGGRSEPLTKEALLQRAESCSDKLYDSDRRIAGFHSLVESMVRVPEEYSYWMRAIGIHPLVSLPVLAVTNSVRNKIRRTFETGLDRLPVAGAITAYRPAERERRSDSLIQEAFRRAANNPLRVPSFTKDEERDLARDFAPVFLVDVAAGYDRPGAVVARAQLFEVDAERPAVYYYTSHAFKGNRPVLQLNYAIWFGARAGRNSPWMERGHLDGLTVRLSLTEDGRVFMMDVMNNCGCYHFFVPDKGSVERVRTRRFRLDPFVPQWLPSVSKSGRFGLRVNSGWHQVERVLGIEEVSGPSLDYELRPYEELESLDGPLGLRLSLFSRRGIAKGTGRIEPLIFFSMGIPSVGSMRQRGHHAIDLVGRSHFDDPNLLNRSFIFKP